MQSDALEIFCAQCYWPGPLPFRRHDLLAGRPARRQREENDPSLIAATKSNKLWISDTQMWTAGPPPVFARHQVIDRNSPCSIVGPQNPGSPNRGFLHWEP